MPRLISSDHVYFPRAMMSGHARRCLNMRVVQELWWHAMPNVVRHFVFSKGNDWKLHPISSYCMCCPRDMITFHARCRPCVSAIQGQWRHAKPNFIQPCVFSKGYDDLPHPKSSNRVYCPRDMITWHTRRRPIVCHFKVDSWNATPDFVLPFVLSKRDVGMPR